MFDKTKTNNSKKQQIGSKNKRMKSDNVTKDEAEPINQHSHLLNGSNDN